jgi:hypothetical protein
LDRLHVIFRTDGDPTVTSIAQDALGVELADVWVFGQKRISFFESATILVVTAGL